MVGRELDSFYTKNKHKIGEVALETKNLSHVKLFKTVPIKECFVYPNTLK